MSKQRLILLTGAFLFLFSSACTIFGLFDGSQRAASESLQATATAEAALTATYGSEVSSVIENFELQWYSLEAYVDPSVQSELATGVYLDYWGYARMGEAIYDEPSWSVITFADVKRIRVLEYNPERFKAVASVSRVFNDITSEGEIIRSSRPDGLCGIYVFIHKDGVWKLAGFFLTNGPPQDVERDWRNAPDWLKDIIGGLPEGDLCEW
jgi:hypothetical protein